MRSSIKCDHRVANAILAIILLVLLLLAYFIFIKPSHEHVAVDGEWQIVKEATCTEPGLRAQICSECDKQIAVEAIPATGHTSTEAIENEIASTCTKGGSYDKVTYCSDCGEEFSRETVQVELKAHTESSPKTENVVNSTHASSGKYDEVVYCKDCKLELSRVEKEILPTGHNYEWEFVYDESTDEFSVVGTCACDEAGNVFVHICDKDTEMVLDTTVPPCCRKVYISNVELFGEVITKTVEVAPDPHKIYDPNGSGELVPITNYIHYDESNNSYYMYNDELDVDTLQHITDSPWDENGFSLGVYKCVVCDEADCSAWHMVRIYSAEHDTSIIKEDN